MAQSARLQGECAVKNMQPILKGIREVSEMAGKAASSTSPSDRRRATTGRTTDPLIAEKMKMMVENVAEFTKGKKKNIQSIKMVT